jgi:hypothetical protein
LVEERHTGMIRLRSELSGEGRVKMIVYGNRRPVGTCRVQSPAAATSSHV